MTKTFRKTMLLITFAVIGSNVVQIANSHCQIPCGIYDDYARVQLMLEDSATIEKADKLIADLAGKSDAQSQNQIVRWVMNKEKHSQNIISTICDYFLTQRVKPTQNDYAERLIKHHAVIIAAMKAKQNADVKYSQALKKSIEALLPYYPKPKYKHKIKAPKKTN